MGGITMILEMGKTYIQRYYNGNLKAAIKAKDGILWTDERIQAAFNNGNGTTSDFKRYMNNNRQHTHFIQI